MQSIRLNGVSRILSSRNKSRTTAAAIIALMALSAVAAVLPAFAQKTYTAVPDRETGTVIGVSPKLVGLGQKALVNIMVYPAPSGPTYYAQDLVGRTAPKGGVGNITVAITKPDGKKDTFMPVDYSLEQVGLEIAGLSQIVGSLMFYYEPDQVGNYSFSASFAGWRYNTDGQYASLNLTVWYKPSSTTKSATLSVQEDIVLGGILNGYPWIPLPTGYWESPVQTNNREWAAISGDWPQASYDAGVTKYNPYSTAPKSSHILWKREVVMSGLPGGVWGSLPYDSQNYPAVAAVMDGKLYQNGPKSNEFSCVDLRTGKTLWTATGSVSLMQNLDPVFQTASQLNEGFIDKWLWGTTSTTWTRYDPFNGAVLQTITGVPSGSMSTMWAEGDPIVWVTNYDGWNTTLPLKWKFENLIKWNYTKVTNNNWLTGIEWNVSIRQPDGVGVGDGRTTVRVYPFWEAGVVMVRSHDDEQIAMGFDYNTGKYLWRNDKMILDIGVGTEPFGPNGPYIVEDGVTQEFVAYNVKTGQEQWRATMGELPWGMLPNYNNVLNIKKGVFYTGSYDGYVYAIDYENGDVIWKGGYLGDSDENIYGHEVFNGRSAVGAGGVVFFNTFTTYRLMPRPRFHQLVALDEETGETLWKLPIGINPLSIAEGIMVGTDGESGIQYAFGKGKTATTVTTQQVQDGMLIEGSVLDLSPGAPNTPAVSEADMAEWMDYLHGQNATLINSPPVPKGVSVQLTAIGSDGNVVDLGSVTSDSTGHFGYYWKSTNAGLYTVYATFAGSESYWASFSSGSGVVAEAQETSSNTASGSTTNNSEVITYVVAGVIAIIIAIAIVGALLLKKGKQ